MVEAVVLVMTSVCVNTEGDVTGAMNESATGCTDRVGPAYRSGARAITLGNASDAANAINALNAARPTVSRPTPATRPRNTVTVDSIALKGCASRFQSL